MGAASYYYFGYKLEKEIGGSTFKFITKEQWKSIGISDEALITILHIKNEKVSVIYKS